MSASYSLMTALKKNSLFRHYSLSSELFSIRTFSKNERIGYIQNGQHSIGVIVQGCIDVFSNSSDGANIHISSLNTGDCFGISNIFTCEELTTTLFSRRVTTIAYLQRSKFLDLMKTEPKLFVTYATLCNQKIRFLTEKIEVLSIQTSRGRLAYYLLKMKNPDNKVILSYSKEQLAKNLGVSRASLFRELKTMAESGLIQIEKNILNVMDPSSLEKIIHYN